MKFVWRMAAVLIGAIGAVGEAYFLWHILVNTLPYKVIAEAGLLEVIADKSLFAAPLIATSLAWLATYSSTKWGLAVATFVCPMIFVLFYAGAFSWAGIQWSDQIGFGGMDQAGLFASFVLEAGRLAVAGAAIGLICGFVIDKAAKSKANDLS